jgi:hypothetical protein
VQNPTQLNSLGHSTPLRSQFGNPVSRVFPGPFRDLHILQFHDLTACLVQHTSFSFTFCMGHVIVCIPEIVFFSSNKLNFGLFWYISVFIKYNCIQLSEMNFATTLCISHDNNTQTSSWINFKQLKVLYQWLDFTIMP